ncbi:hypothetical protein BX600DRAFT_430863 [Xylariales sp. PMI_506]|nr:hypothetical protein BX600DRAFT_430863 [Xylariales sp. PMI_506]
MGFLAAVGRLVHNILTPRSTPAEIPAHVEVNSAGEAIISSGDDPTQAPKRRRVDGIETPDEVARQPITTTFPFGDIRGDQMALDEPEPKDTKQENVKDLKVGQGMITPAHSSQGETASESDVGQAIRHVLQSPLEPHEAHGRHEEMADAQPGVGETRPKPSDDILGTTHKDERQNEQIQHPSGRGGFTFNAPSATQLREQPDESDEESESEPSSHPDYPPAWDTWAPKARAVWLTHILPAHLKKRSMSNDKFSTPRTSTAPSSKSEVHAESSSADDKQTSSTRLLRHVPRRRRFKDINEWFDHDAEYSLPGLGDHELPLNPLKRLELDEQKEARIRREQEEKEAARRRLEEAIREAKRREEEERRKAELEKRRKEEEQWKSQLDTLGLRKPRSTLIVPLDCEWEERVMDSVHSGRAKTPGPESLDFQPRDFARLVPQTAWLNDSCIQAGLSQAAAYVNRAAGVTIKKDTPKCVALNSYFWSSIVGPSGVGGKERMLKRVWGLTPQNFFDVETILVPINLNAHWTFILVRPSRKEISYIDSFHSTNEARLDKIREFLGVYLGDKYNEADWKTVSFKIPLQTNSYDCGMFVITNSIYLALGIDPSGYAQDDMPLQRRRIAASILNGGFTGEFDLAHL